MPKQLVIQVGQVEFGISINHVISIEKMVTPSPLPLMPEYFMGIVDIRQKIVPLIDMNGILYNKKTKITDNTRLVLIDMDNLSIALIVDEAKEIIIIDSQEIKPLQSLLTTDTSFFEGVVRLNHRLVSLIDIKKLLNGLTNLEQIREQVSLYQS
ncbi:chemotaxis protein CheW [Peribacillus tepidiphilus]|uniref:chemotaxis protein CheW n=1 Tax=Peribacillus tepidiphilus TaxID=2652445 RepID=UPI001291181D|nr:chemotaxis protein CheW [Peribacillus tepidiphilus]